MSTYGYKKVRLGSGVDVYGNPHDIGYAILKMEILGERRGPRSDDGVNKKCRTSKAMPVRAWKYLRGRRLGRKISKNTKLIFYSGHDKNFRYCIGKIAVPENGFARNKEVCAEGIHYFKTPKEALAYSI